MNFDFTDDQQAIKSTANDMLAARFKPERVRELAEADEYDDGAWKEMAELGWAGIFIDEEHGGQGLGVVELVILMEELGYVLAPVPFLSNAAAGLALQFAGTDEQKERWLPGHRVGRGARHGGRAARRRGAARSRCRLSRGDRADRAGRREHGGRGLGCRDRAVRGDGPHAPLRARARRRRRAARGRPACRGRPHRHGPVRRDGRRRAEGDGDGRGVCARPQAVRPPDRLLPGRLAPLRADAARGGGLALGRATTPPGAPTPSRSRCRRPRRWRRRTPPTPAGACAARRCRCTAASASPGSTTCTSS